GVQGMLVVLALGLAAGAVRADTVMLADGQPLMGDLKPGKTPGELLLARPGEAPMTLKREDILAIDFGRPPADPKPIIVTLQTGARLLGPVSFASGPSLAVKRADGVLKMPLTSVATVRLKAEVALPAPAASDVVVLANGDKIQGRIEAADASKIVIRSS